jgi:thymidine kinase
MARASADVGSLEMIIGCMFSGKSSALIHRIRQNQLLGRRMLLVTHASDTRYKEDAIYSHDRIHVDATSLTDLMMLLPTDIYRDAEVVFIEEAQFFPDLILFVKQAVDIDNKRVVLSGLDGDYDRKPFQQIVDLIPFAESVEKRSALCLKCNDGTPACFSKRKVWSGDRCLVGAGDLYVPVCRLHYSRSD